MSEMSSQELWKLTRSIVESDPVISVFASTEWDELSDDGKFWLVAIVHETLSRSAAREMLAALKQLVALAPQGSVFRQDADAAIAKAEGRA